ncbi:Twin-arginine translocation pathway signal [Thauera humireducens]|uniref:DUF1513 domain-containing protein n=1 Tax=Thauera humireducens TaxID=1134435 RepID=UPI002467A193|nr:DUF1513 domain-containing protein [Thauera humireducens]CAH1747767.1 Twin-arginine translocation pathway signal [Thauera humireducens]
MATDPQRRRVLATLSGAGLIAGLPPLARAAITHDRDSAPRLLTCWSDSPTRPSTFHAGWVDAPAQALALPARGHDIAWHPSADGTAVVVARRPGDFLVRWHVATGAEIARFEADDESRFEGHIAFRADGRVLYATETDLITGDGRIGVFDALTLERLDAWPCGGIGPHAVECLADGRLAVAVGGILTLPETGRVKRNLGSMDPSLTFLDPSDGRLLSQCRLDDAFMSVRHIAQAADGRVAVSLQNEGRTARPLFAIVDGERLRYGEADADLLSRCGGYAGDIVAVGELFAVSCSTAGVTAVWSGDGSPHTLFDTPRVCALSTCHGCLVITSDTGKIWEVSLQRGIEEQARIRLFASSVALDNHAASEAS